MRLKNHKVAVGRNTSLSCPELYPQNTFSDFPIPAKTAGSLALLKGKATIFIKHCSYCEADPKRFTQKHWHTLQLKENR